MTSSRLGVLDEVSREVKIDICIPFEGGPNTPDVAWQQKLGKYNRLVAELSSKGKRVSLDDLSLVRSKPG